MKRPSGRLTTAAAMLATLAFASPAGAQLVGPGDLLPYPRTAAHEQLVATSVDGRPTVEQVAAICGLDNSNPAFIATLLADFANLPKTVTASWPHLDDDFSGSAEQLEVNLDDSTGQVVFTDVSAKSQRAGTPGPDAVVALGATDANRANVFCRLNLVTLAVAGLVTPDGPPVRLEWYWTRGTCLPRHDNVVDACYAYNGTPSGSLSLRLPPAVAAPEPEDAALDPNKQPAQTLVEVVIGEDRPNQCGCPHFEINDDGTWPTSTGTNDGGNLQVVQRLVRFCDASLPIVFETDGTVLLEKQLQGSCPFGGVLSGLDSQSTQTSGLCNRILTSDGKTVNVGAGGVC